MNFIRAVSGSAILTLLISLAAAGQVPATPAAPAAPVAKPQVAFASVHLPSWMRLGVEHRGRLEGFTGAGFASDKEDLYWLNRFRVTARLTPRPWLTAAIQAQDARVEGKNGTIIGAPFRDQIDLRQAYADLGAFEKSRFAVRAGRQEMVFGDQRLIGHANWLNTARSVDGARAVVRPKQQRRDGFAVA